MWWDIPNEDEYWERRREEYENPNIFRRRSLWEEKEPIYEDGSLYIDDLIDKIEAERESKMENLEEYELKAILEELADIEVETAKWNERTCGIDYRVRVS